MSFNDFHKTVHSSDRALLFSITMGATVWRYTSKGFNIEVTVESGSFLYSDYPGIQVSEFNNSGDSERNEVTLTLDTTAPICAHLLQYIPTQEIYLQVFSIELNDPDGEVINEWRGVYSRYEANYPEMGLVFAPFDMQMGREVLSTCFGLDCQWVQYDANCGLSPLAFDINGTLISRTNFDLTTNLNFTSISANHFLGGYIEINGLYGSERAWIRQVISSNVVRVDRLLPGFANNIPIKGVPSCRGSFEICADPALFDNKIKFMGAPYADKVNPFIGSLKGDK